MPFLDVSSMPVSSSMSTVWAVPSAEVMPRFGPVSPAVLAVPGCTRLACLSYLSLDCLASLRVLDSDSVKGWMVFGATLCWLACSLASPAWDGRLAAVRASLRAREASWETESCVGPSCLSLSFNPDRSSSANQSSRRHQQTHRTSPCLKTSAWEHIPYAATPRAPEL
eukprot:scaffold2011_cov233-Pinguiococcus_pyrenoidosus.AAC.7